MNTILKNLDRSFLNGVGWLGLSQVIVRFARLATTIIVARLLIPEHFGLAAIILAVNEFTHVFAKTGTASRVINATDDELQEVSHSANHLNWLIGISLFLLQCLVAYPLSLAYGNTDLILPLLYLATSYLLLPIAMIHCSLNIRDQKMSVVAKSEMLQGLVDAFLTIGLALAGFGLWALIIPKVLVIPLWIILHRRHSNWKKTHNRYKFEAQRILKFTRRVLGVELLSVFRHNIDYVLIGYFLGIHALGIYFFAYNAGLGISRGLISVLNNALYPHLCSSQGDQARLRTRFKTGIKLNLYIVIPIIALQAVTAAIYVPLVFGQRWEDLGAVPVVILICLTGLPIALTETFSQLLRAANQPSIDLDWHSKFSIVFIIVVMFSLQWGLIGVAIGILLLQYASIPVHYFRNIRPIVSTGSKSIVGVPT